MFLSRKLWAKNNLQNYYEEQKQRQLQEIKQTNPAKYRKIMAYLKKNS